MASPQKENGYTAIANEILERLCLPGINGSEYRVLNLVIRKTYGYNKKQDYISITQFQKGTLMNRAHAIRTIQSLVAKRILVKDGSVYRFNKNWEEWRVGKRNRAYAPPRPRFLEICYSCSFTKALEVHHIKPKSEGGSNDFSNLINLCANCHSLADSGQITREGLLALKAEKDSTLLCTDTITSTQLDTTASTQLDTKTSTQLGTYKRKKDNITKDIAQSAGNEVNQIISLFEEVNPSFSKFFAHKSQREAVSRMLSKFGREKVEVMVGALPQVNAKPYWPKSTTPIELENNLGKYKALNESDKLKNNKKGNQKIFKL